MSEGKYFLVVCLNPTIQKTIVLARLAEGCVNRSAEHYLDASGKGMNVARALAALGENTLHLTHGGGRTGELFLSLARETRVDVKAVDSGSDVRFCHTIVAKGAGTTTEIVEEAAPVAGDTDEHVFDEYLRHLPGACAVVITGSRAAGYSPSIFPRMVKASRETGKFIVLDVRGGDLIASLPEGPDAIKPNYEEYVATFFPGRDPDDTALEPAVREHMIALARIHRTCVVITRGAGECIFTEGKRIASVRPPAIAVLNTTGCGDAFCAGFTRSYREHRNAARAVAFGIECATRAARTVHPFIE